MARRSRIGDRIARRSQLPLPRQLFAHQFQGTFQQPAIQPVRESRDSSDATFDRRQSVVRRVIVSKVDSCPNVAADVLTPVDHVHAPARLREDPRGRGAGEAGVDDEDLRPRHHGFSGGKFMRAALARNASSGSIVRQVGGGRRPSLASSMTGRSFANASMSRCRVRP